MLMCNETVTLVRHIELEDGDQYDCIIISGVSWYAKTAITDASQRLTTANVFKCRIPGNLLPDKYKPRTGDYFVRGKINNIGGPADLKGTDHFRITAIGDNRRGCNPHWAVSGA